MQHVIKTLDPDVEGSRVKRLHRKRGKPSKLSCVPGYMGTYCEIDVDDCESNPCVNDGKCRDMVNGFTCTCQPGKNEVTTSCEVSPPLPVIGRKRPEPERQSLNVHPRAEEGGSAGRAASACPVFRATSRLF